jgi:hypothetical protein
MDNTALEALYAAAEAIRTLADVTEATADNDHNSGEVIFSLANGESYALKLSRLDDELPTADLRGETK